MRAFAVGKRQPPRFGLVRRFSPDGDRTLQVLTLVDPSLQASTRELAGFRLGPVPPTAELRRVVNLESLRQPSRRLGCPRRVQRSPLGRVQIIPDQPDLLRIEIGSVAAVAEVAKSTAVRRSVPLNATPARQRFELHEPIRRPVPLVFGVDPLRGRRDRRPRFADPSLAGLVQTPDRPLGIGRPLVVDLRHVFHRTLELRFGLRRNRPRFAIIFFGMARTPSVLIDSPICRSTRLAANRRSVTGPGLREPRCPPPRSGGLPGCRRAGGPSASASTSPRNSVSRIKKNAARMRKARLRNSVTILMIRTKRTNEIIKESAR